MKEALKTFITFSVSPYLCGKPFRLSFVLAWLLCAAGVASAQTLDVKIGVVSASPARVHIEGRKAVTVKSRLVGRSRPPGRSAG